MFIGWTSSSKDADTAHRGLYLAALLLSLLMVGAIYYVKADVGVISSSDMPGAELDLAYLTGLIALIAFGPGSASLDAAIGLESTTNRQDTPSSLVSA